MVHIMDIINMELQQHGIDVVLQLQVGPNLPLTMTPNHDPNPNHNPNPNPNPRPNPYP